MNILFFHASSQNFDIFVLNHEKEWKMKNKKFQGKNNTRGIFFEG